MTSSGLQQHPTLLYVDDSHWHVNDFSRLVTEFLPSAALHIASSPSDALRVVEQRSIDVVVMSAGLYSELGSVSLVKELKSNEGTARIPVIVVLPPEAEKGLVRRVVEEGCDELIRQPIEALELVTRIESMFRIKKAEDLMVDCFESGGAPSATVSLLLEMVEGNADGLVVVGEDGLIRFVNRAAVNLLGQDRRSLLGRSFDLPLAGELFMEVDLRSPDGQVRKGETRAVAAKWEGKPIWIVSIRDVTEQHRVEDQLRQAQKLEAVSQLASSVAHDFKNILHGVLGFTSLVRESLDRESEEYGHLREVEKAAEKGGMLTQQLQAFSRQQEVEGEDLDVNEFLESKLMRLQQVIGDELQLRFFPTASVPLIHADPILLEQVLIQLCENARDATRTRGVVTITTGLIRFNEMEMPEYAWASSGRYVTVSVDDNGAGMDLGTQSQIFEPFFTTKEQEGKTGLGLSIVYGIITQHQGNIEVTSAPGEGTDVTIYLPTTEKDLTRASRMPPAANAGESTTILLAEDDDIIRTLTSKVLQKAKYTVLVAADGVEAVEKIEAQGDEIALAILDVAMPHLSGFDVFEKIREGRPELPVLFVTGHGAISERQKFELDGNTKLLQKPFRPPTLLRKVRDLLHPKKNAD